MSAAESARVAETEPTPAEIFARAAHTQFRGDDRWHLVHAKVKAAFTAEANAGLRALANAGYEIRRIR